MIPEKKKTPEEIAALRGELGIPKPPSASPQSEPPRNRPPERSSHPLVQPIAPPQQTRPPIAPVPAPVLDPVHPDQSPRPEDLEPVVHLDITPAPAPGPESPQDKIQSHSLRKHELPLGPAPVVTKKTAIPSQRHDDRDIAEIRRRQALASLTDKPQDPAVFLKRITAHPALLAAAYLIAFGAVGAAWQRVAYITPLALIGVSLILVIYIFFAKKRSRHHAAILAIIIIMTLVFGGLHYAPLFSYAP